MQGPQIVSTHASLKCESVWFKTKLVSQFLTLSFLLTQPFYLTYLHAAPVGGDIVGGTGSISQADLTTTINQTSQNLAVDWQSFDVNTNERVQFIQPNTSSIALNRILGNNGSTIQGQIDANGQVILVNPNGIFFTSTATINVGGLIASSLDMAPSDFMNGNYVFNEVIGADGAVINSGIINASIGGNVALIGKQVKNDGLISANLGSVVLAAGKQSVLTFDNQGLIGVKVTKEILQEEVGLDEAVINNGSINASGGRVLLTASTSQDIFSQAVNTGLLDQATSVVVNDDGTFTLGAGADVLNSGSIDVSSDVNTDNTARIVLLGENITSSGQISADVIDGQAGEIELHARDETLLTENSITSAQAFVSGQGGLIKVLGDKVGLFDSAQVNASGTNGGGEVLIGGDQQGLNTLIRNANFIYLGENTSVNADATLNGDGGKIITFANDTARLYGNLYARGGGVSGNGGFIETSGKKSFFITQTPDITAINGNAGHWLIDPNNITIVASEGSEITTTTTSSSDTAFDSTGTQNATLDVDLIEAALDGTNATVTITTSNPNPSNTTDGNITFEADIDFNGKGSDTLILNAANDIDTNTNNIWDTDTSSGTDILNIEFNADADNNGSGDVILDDSRIYTNGGSFTSTGQNFTSSRGNGDSGTHYLDTRDKTNNTKGGDVYLYMQGDVDIGAEIYTGGGKVDIGDMRVAGSEIRPTSFINQNNGKIITTGEDNIDGGAITINVDNSVDADGTITINAELESDGGTAVKGSTGVIGRNAGAITLNATGDIDITKNINSNGTQGDFDGGDDFGQNGGDGGSVNIKTSTGDINFSSTTEVSTKGGDGDGDKDSGTAADPGSGGNGGSITIEASLGSITADKLTSNGGVGKGGADYPNDPGVYAKGGDGGAISLLASTTGKTITLNDDINASGGNMDNVGNNGYGADVTFNGDVVLGNSISIDSIGFTIFPDAVTSTGHVWFKNSISGDRTKNLSISANDIIFDADIGTAGQHLGDVTLNAAGYINADTNTLYLDTLDVTNSNKFRSGNIDAIGVASSDVTLDGNNRTITINSDTTIDTGNLIANAVEDTVDSVGRDGGVVQLSATGKITTGSIDTSGSDAFAVTNSTFKDVGGAGGSVQLAAEEIEVGAINTSGGNAVGENKKGGDAGSINLDATSGTNNVANIILNSDINSKGGLATGTAANGASEIAALSTNGTGVGTITIKYSSAYTSFVDITGNTSNDTIIGSARNNNWNITGTDDGDLNTKITFTNIENLTGNNTQDDFVFNGGTLSGEIDGGVNTVNTVFNSITGDAVDNVWSINTNDDSGTVTGLGGRFSNIGNLIGNTARDDFSINGDVSLTGSIDGVGGSDADAALKNSLIINTVSDNTWEISSSDSGSVTVGVGGGFLNIQKVKGGSGDDTFNIGINGSLDLIEGGADNSQAGTPTLGDIVNFTALTTADGVDVTLGTALTSSQTDINIDSVEQINADASATTNNLTGQDIANTWNITKADGGDVESTVNFNNFTNLNGGSADDTFTVGLNGSLSGEIDGGGQATPSGDKLDLSQRLGVVLNINGTTGNSLSYTGAGTSINYNNIETIVGNSNDNSIVNGDNVDTEWEINGVDSGTVSSTTSINVTQFSGFNILNGGTANDSFTITSTGAITGIINGGGDASVANGDILTVSTPSDMVNLALGTTDNINATNITDIEKIYGDGLNVTLIGENLTETTVWNITDSNEGYLNYSGGTGTVNFYNVSNLTGNSGNDKFDFALGSAASISGLIDGGSQTDNDIVDMSKLTTSFTVTLDNDIVGIERIIGNNYTLTSLEGAPYLTTWTVTGPNDGNASYTDGNSNLVDVDFINFSNLSGNNDVNDVFRVTSGSISGKIDGGTGLGIDSIDYSLSDLTNVNLGDATNGFDGIEHVIGKLTMTLTGLQTGNSTNSWLIYNDINNVQTDGLNDGAVTYNSDPDNLPDKILSFSNFGTLQAGNNGDDFTIDQSGAFEGTIIGGAGNDSLEITLSGTQTTSTIFNGGGGTDSLTLNGDNSGAIGDDSGYSGVYTPNNANNNEEFVYTNQGNAFTVEYNNTETIQDDLNATALTVNGSSDNDTFTLANGSFQVTGNNLLGITYVGKTVNYTNKTNLIVDGLDSVTTTPDADNIIITEPITIDGDFSFRAETLTIPNTVNLITSGGLYLESINNVEPAVPGDSVVINTSVDSLGISDSGAIYINEEDAIDIDVLSTSGLVDITTVAGDITSTSELASNGEFLLTATTGDINIAGTNNELTGLISLKTGLDNDTVFNNTTRTLINEVTTRDLTINAIGTSAYISQNYAASGIAANDAVFNSSGIIDLGHSSNNFSTINAVSLEDIYISDTDSIGLNTITGNNVTIISGGDIIDSNDTGTPVNNITANRLTLIAETGIGDGNPIEIRAAYIDARNNTNDGTINLRNTGNVESLTLINDGDISLYNEGNVEIKKIDAGYGVRDPLTPGGTLTLEVVGGSVTADETSKTYTVVSDITAFNANIAVPGGTFGSAGRPISVYVNNRFDLFSLQSAVIYIGEPNIKNDTSTAKISITDAFSSLAGQQLIEVESIGDIDPAIFTDVRNYSHSDLALMMPSDQRYDFSDEEEEDKDAKEKRNKLINSEK